MMKAGVYGVFKRMIKGYFEMSLWAKLNSASYQNGDSGIGKFLSGAGLSEGVIFLTENEPQVS
jgi:hypothetical protein